LIFKRIFENLNEDFKVINSEVKNVYTGSSPVAALALSVVLFQIIEFNLVISTDEERATILENTYDFLLNFQIKLKNLIFFLIF